jgi:hypothetical protein
MSEQSPLDPQQPAAKSKGMTPAQVGAGVGAGLTILFLFALRDLWPQGPAGNLPSFLIGVLGAVGAILGMAAVSLVNVARGRRRTEAAEAAIAGVNTEEALPAQVVPDAPDGKGSPILRVAAGILALLFAGAACLVIAQGGSALAGAVLPLALAVLFGWYAARGRKGLPL